MTLQELQPQILELSIRLERLIVLNQDLLDDETYYRLADGLSALKRLVR